MQNKTVRLFNEDVVDRRKLLDSAVYINVLCECVCMRVCMCLEASTQQEHEEDGTEEDAECAHSGNHDLCHHLHVTYQRVWDTGQM